MLASVFGTAGIVGEEFLLAAGSPGFIVGPFARLLGAIFNLLFNIVYGITPVASLAVTIIIFTVIVRACLVPLMVKSHKSTYMMQKIQPEMTKIQNKYKGKNDPQSQQKMAYEIQKLQKDNGVSMLGGCLPMLIQLPILYAMFYIFQQAFNYVDVINVLYNEITEIFMAIPVAERVELLKPIALAHSMSMDLAVESDMFGLVNVLTKADWTNILTNAGAEISALLEPLSGTKNAIEYFCGISLVNNSGWKFPGIILPILAGLTTWLSTKVQTDRQKKSQETGQNKTADSINGSMNTMMMIMPFFMAFICLSMPAALGLYWTIGNVIQMITSVILNKIFDKKFGEIKVSGDNKDIIDIKTK
ncbi:MAG: YidC/Oxa1 family membrane protein insertase [Lachnospiraceae bacterium]|nr:YidC/Oxa1 family membrane protein insertase [Lachnospiraceae bacterium]